MVPAIDQSDCEIPLCNNLDEITALLMIDSLFKSNSSIAVLNVPYMCACHIDFGEACYMHVVVYVAVAERRAACRRFN